MVTVTRSPTPTPAAPKKQDIIKDVLRKAIQRYIAVCAYYSMKPKSLTIKQLQVEIEKRYLGKSEMVGQVWKFINHKESFYSIIVYKDEDVLGNSIYAIDPKFSGSVHPQIVLNRHVTRDLLKQTFINQPRSLLKGRTIKENSFSNQ